MPTLMHSDYAHAPTLEDVKSSNAHKSFKASLLRREAQTFTDLAAVAKQRGWHFMARNYAFKATQLQRHADFLAPF
jgi:hypothetical protein